MNFLAGNNFKIRQQFYMKINIKRPYESWSLKCVKNMEFSRSNSRCFGNISCSWSLTMHWNALSTHNFLFSFLTVLAFLDTLIYSCIKDRKIVIQHTTKIGMLRTNILVAYSRLKIVNLKNIHFRCCVSFRIFFKLALKQQFIYPNFRFIFEHLFRWKCANARTKIWFQIFL